MYHFRGHPSNSKRYKILVGCSYGLPLIVSTLTVIVEFSAPKCASYRPRFGEESCFFSGKLCTMSSRIITFHNYYIIARINSLKIIFLL